MSASQLLKQANQLKRQGKLDEAIALYHRVIEINPHFAWTYQLLGEALLKKDHLNEAITEYKRAIENNQNCAFFYYDISRLLALQNRVDEAINYIRQAITVQTTEFYLREAIKLQPEQSDFYRLLATVYREAGDLEKAIVNYQKAIELNPQGCLWNYKDLGDIFSSQERWSEAIAVYESATNLYPEHTEISSSLAVAQSKSKNPISKNGSFTQTDSSFPTTELDQTKAVLTNSNNYIRKMAGILFEIQYRNIKKLEEYDDFLEFINQTLDYSYSQKIQDLWGLWENRDVQKGYFVEFGALSGINVSNTYLMELLGWDGIVAEPHPSYREILSKNRKCNISYDAVYSITGKKLVFKAVVGSPALSTLEVSLPEDNQRNIDKRKNATDYIVKTISLNDLLDQFNAPSIIDFVSIDTEGSELDILSTFDFTKYAFKAICIEYGTSEKRQKIFEILTQNNYIRKWEELSEHDDWYVNEKICNPIENAQNLLGRLRIFKNDLIVKEDFMLTADEKKKERVQKLLGKNLSDSDQPQSTKYRVCAIFQFEGVHEIVIPTLIYTLNSAGYRPRVYINARCQTQRGDIFSYVDELDFDLYYWKIEEHKDWEQLTRKAQSEDVEFICISTFQSDGVAKWAVQAGKPTIGVIHNTEIFLASEHCRAALAEGWLQVITLGRHVASFLYHRIEKSLIDRVGVVEPIFLGSHLEGNQASAEAGKERVVAITGGVNFKTRDHYALLEALEEPKLRRSLDGVVFKVLGGGSDRTILEKEVAERGLSPYIQFAPLGSSGMVLYDDYFAALREATFLHPLIPLSFYHYRECKISTTISTAITFNLPMFLDRWTMNTYNVPAFVSDATVSASIACLVAIEEGEVIAQREALAAYYHLSLAQGVEEMKRLIYAIA